MLLHRISSVYVFPTAFVSRKYILCASYIAMSSSGDNGKKKCPYMEKCYRKNPIHFSEMSHPHLERLVVDQLDGTVKVPEHLDFECTDHSQLLDQLKVLQIVLRKERDKDRNNSSVSKNQVPKIQTSDVSVINTSGDSLKDKVERHKKETAQRREKKLLEMDAKAEAEAKSSESLSVASTSDINGSRSESPVGRKRGPKTFEESSNEVKRSKANSSEIEIQERNKEKDIEQKDKDSKTSESVKGTSIIDLYKSCNSSKSRDEVRKKAIMMMKQQGFDVSVVEPGEFALKYALSAPYHLFFTRVQKSKPTYDQQYSITFPEILDRSLGEVVSSLQINFMVDVGWLCLQYLLAGQSADMLILYGERVDEEKLSLNITMIPVQIPTRFGCHHTKVMVLRYKDNGIRVVVSTANLYSDDWENRTQGLWISPHLPELPESANPSDGESPTGFKRDFERYLSKYRHPALTEWIYMVRRADFSAVNVFFLASVPGSHKDAEYDLWGHRRLAQILSKHATLPPDAPQWPIVAQCSSIGSLGPSYESWLLKEIVSCMSRETDKGLKSHPNFRFIYPSISNYKQSFDCQVGSCCLPYSLQNHSKQEWIESYMCQWKATKTARDRAMPHIKSYTRLSPDLKKIPWFVLTSANLSKAAWGSNRSSHHILNYEAGVVFIPKLIIGETTFPLTDEVAQGTPVFPIPYDLPLTRYESQDKPFVTEFFRDSS